MLDQPVGLGLRDRVGADDLAVLEAELGLEALHLERGARPAPGEGRGRLPGKAERLGDRAPAASPGRRRSRRAAS